MRITQSGGNKIKFGHLTNYDATLACLSRMLAIHVSKASISASIISGFGEAGFNSSG